MNVMSIILGIVLVASALIVLSRGVNGLICRLRPARQTMVLQGSVFISLYGLLVLAMRAADG